MEIIIIFPVFIGIALATAQLSYEKGYSARWWFLGGLFFPIISFLVLFALKSKPKSNKGYHAPVDMVNKDKVLFKRVN